MGVLGEGAMEIKEMEIKEEAHTRGTIGPQRH